MKAAIRKTRMEAKLERKRREFCSKVALLKHEAGTLNLFYTMQKLDDAMKMVGYEVAGTPELANPMLSKTGRKKVDGACCDNEVRSFSGGCVSCGDPCL